MILDFPNSLRMDFELEGKIWTVMYENGPIYYWPNGEVINVDDYHQIPKFVYDVAQYADKYSKKATV